MPRKKKHNPMMIYVGVVAIIIVAAFLALTISPIIPPPPPPPNGNGNGNGNGVYLEWQNNFTDGAMLLPYPWNSPVIIVELGTPYPYKLVVYSPPDDYWSFRRATNIRGPYEEVARVSTPDKEAPQCCRKNKDGYYYYYTSWADNYARLYIAPPNDWTAISLYGDTLGSGHGDCGVFYDPETGMWHMHYQYGSGAHPPTIGWATSPNGRTNWVDHGLVITAPFDTGDPEIIKIDDVYYMFVDNSMPHPNYRIAVYHSLDLQQQHWVLDKSIVTEHAGGDLKPLYTPEEGEFYGFVEYWTGVDFSTGYMRCKCHQNGLSYMIDPRYNRMDIYVTV